VNCMRENLSYVINSIGPSVIFAAIKRCLALRDNINECVY
jgi:hypothetical protein